MPWKLTQDRDGTITKEEIQAACICLKYSTNVSNRQLAEKLEDILFDKALDIVQWEGEGGSCLGH